MKDHSATATNAVWRMEAAGGTTAAAVPIHQGSGRIVQASARPLTNEQVERAVFAHIKAVRSLGKRTVNTAEIAKALGVPVTKVNAAAAQLRRKGVRVAK